MGLPERQGLLQQEGGALWWRLTEQSSIAPNFSFQAQDTNVHTANRFVIFLAAFGPC